MVDYAELLVDQDDDDQGMTAVRKALRAADKRAKEAEERADKAEAKTRSDSVKDLVRQAGLKEAVARYVPKDVEDADSLETWLKSDEGSVFADSKAVVSNDPPPADDPALALFQRLANAEAGADSRQSIQQDQVGQVLGGLAGQGLKEADILAAFAALDQGKVPGS